MITRRGIIGAIALTGIAGVVGPRWAYSGDARVRDAHMWGEGKGDLDKGWYATPDEAARAHIEELDDEPADEPMIGALFGIKAILHPTALQHAYFRVPMRGIITDVFAVGTPLSGPGGDVQTIEDLMLARVDEDDFVACGRMGLFKVDKQYRALDLTVNGRGIARAT